jgi:hypothetical protein
VLCWTKTERKTLAPISSCCRPVYCFNCHRTINQAYPNSPKDLGLDVDRWGKVGRVNLQSVDVFDKGYWGEFCFWIVRSDWCDIKNKQFVWKSEKVLHCSSFL